MLFYTELGVFIFLSDTSFFQITVSINNNTRVLLVLHLAFPGVCPSFSLYLLTPLFLLYEAQPGIYSALTVVQASV